MPNPLDGTMVKKSVISIKLIIKSEEPSTESFGVKLELLMEIMEKLFVLSEKIYQQKLWVLK